jgi:integrase/recombinase XerD
MIDPPTEVVAVLVDVPLARPGERPTANPAQLYIASLNTKQSRQTGVQAMKRLLKVFSQSDADWWSFPWWKVTAQEATMAQNTILSRYSPSTARLTMCALRRILKQCYRLRLMTAEDHLRAVDLDRITAESAPAGRMLKKEERSALIAYADTLGGDYGAMVAAIFATALGGGLRREELARLGVQPVAPVGATIRFMGKRSKVRDQRLPQWATDRLRAWLAVRGERSSKTMFLRTQGRHLKDVGPSVWSIWSLIVETGKAAGVAPFTPHDLRRTYGSRMLDLADLSLTRKALGHDSIETTALYDRRDDDRLAAAIDRLESDGF